MPTNIRPSETLPIALAEQAAAELGEPVVEGGEAADDAAAEEHVSVSPCDRGGVVERPADRDHRVHELAGEPEGHRRDRDEGVPGGGAKTQGAVPERGDPVEEDRARSARSGRARRTSPPIVQPSLIGAMYMFCIQASRPRTRDRGDRDGDRAMAEDRLARERRQDLGDRAGSRQHDDQVRAGEEDVGQVLVEQRRAAGPRIRRRRRRTAGRSSSIVSAAIIIGPITISM